MRAQKITHHPELINETSRIKLAQMIVRLFDHWKIDTLSQLMLLGLSPTSRAMLSRYRHGAPLPFNQDLLDRVGWLLSIHQVLRSLYSDNVDICYSWITIPNENFQNQAPLEYMKMNGLIGIAKVARFLQKELVL